MHPLQRWWVLQALPAQRHRVGGEQLGGAAQAGVAVVGQGGAACGAEIAVRHRLGSNSRSTRCGHL